MGNPRSTPHRPSACRRPQQGVHAHHSWGRPRRSWPQVLDDLATVAVHPNPSSSRGQVRRLHGPGPGCCSGHEVDTCAQSRQGLLQEQARPAHSPTGPRTRPPRCCPLSPLIDQIARRGLAEPCVERPVAEGEAGAPGSRPPPTLPRPPRRLHSPVGGMPLLKIGLDIGFRLRLQFPALTRGLLLQLLILLARRLQRLQ